MKRRTNFPYLFGVYLAVNAISDSYLLVDGPDCAIFKTEFIFGNHDIFSTLMNCYKTNRIWATCVDTKSIWKNREEDIIKEISKLENFEKSGLVFICSLPMASILGIQYDSIIRKMNPPCKKPVIVIPGKSLSGDWLDGYSETLNAIASQINLPKGKPEKNNVAIVGYLMDRTEEDHIANLIELKRILKSLSLNVVSIWLDNKPAKELYEIKKAETIISLPYGREAAKTLAERINIKHIEAPLPFGIEGTTEFIMEIAKAYGREEQAEKFIEKEMKKLVPKLEWIIPRFFLNKNIFISCDPHLLDGLLDISKTLGLKVVCSMVMGRKEHYKKKEDSSQTMVFFEPRENIAKYVRTSNNIPSLVIGNYFTFPYFTEKNTPFVEFGFPSYFYHTISETPFLGFKGCLFFIQRMLDALSLFMHKERREGGTSHLEKNK